MLVCTLGDLLLDVVVKLDGPLVDGAESPGRAQATPGGQAANVAAWVAALGGRARVIAKRGDDAAGGLVAAELVRRGVEVAGPVGSGTTGCVVSLVSPDGHRTMISDRGVAPSLAPGELSPGWLDCDVVHVSGYALLQEQIRAAAGRAVELARANGARVSVDLPPWTTIGDGFRERLLELAPDVVFATEEERLALGGELPAAAWVLKRGSRGSVAASGAERIELPPSSGPIVDSTGAGDALAAGFLLGGSLREAAERGAAAAARCLARLGAMP